MSTGNTLISLWSWSRNVDLGYRMGRSLPLVLISVGAVLISMAGGYLIYPRAINNPQAVHLPGEIVGQSLTRSRIGQAAVSDETAAQRMHIEMENRIAEGHSPFVPVGERTFEDRTIYELEGMNQRHFYFRSGHWLVWLAADPAVADDALTAVLDFYP